MAQGQRRLRDPVAGQVGAGGQELQRVAAHQREARPAALRRLRRGRRPGARQPHRQVALPRVPDQGGGRRRQGAALQHRGGKLQQMAGSVEVGQAVDGGERVAEPGHGHLVLMAAIGGVRGESRRRRLGGRAGVRAPVEHAVAAAALFVDQVGHGAELAAHRVAQGRHHHHCDPSPRDGGRRRRPQQVRQHRSAGLGRQVGHHQLMGGGFPRAVQAGGVHAAAGGAGNGVGGGVVGGDGERQGVPVARGHRGGEPLRQRQPQHAGAAAQIENRTQAACLARVGGELPDHAGEQQPGTGVYVVAAEQRLRQRQPQGVALEPEGDRLVEVVAQRRGRGRRGSGATPARSVRHTPRFRCSPRCGRHP